MPFYSHVVKADAAYVPPRTFLGVGGLKIFRDDIWGPLRPVFLADHRAYRELGLYDFPQRDLRMRALNAIVPLLFRVRPFREEFARRVKGQMVQPYQEVLQAAEVRTVQTTRVGRTLSPSGAQPRAG